MVTMGDISQEETKLARSYFTSFDQNKKGNIDGWELRLALEALGHFPSDEAISSMVNEFDENRDGRLELAEFLRAIAKQKANEQSPSKAADLVGAWVAMGGQPDKTGTISADGLRKVRNSISWWWWWW